LRSWSTLEGLADAADGARLVVALDDLPPLISASASGLRLLRRWISSSSSPSCRSPAPARGG
jgi:hypothetical protein